METTSIQEQVVDVPIKDNRMYRIAMPFAAVGDDDSMIVEGYATTFDVPYELEGSAFGSKETVLRTALEGADMSDVIFQYDHSGPVMARTRNNTLQLECDAHGLHVRADLSGCEHGRDLYESIRNGLVDRMSWGFTVAEGGWDFDLDDNTQTITQVAKVYDVSAVSIPANQGTDIYARSAFDGEIEKAREEFAEAARKKDELEMRTRMALLMELEG